MASVSIVGDDAILPRGAMPIPPDYSLLIISNADGFGCAIHKQKEKVS